MKIKLTADNIYHMRVVLTSDIAELDIWIKQSKTKENDIDKISRWRKRQNTNRALLVKLEYMERDLL